MFLVLARRVDVDHDPAIFYFDIHELIGVTPYHRPRSFGQLTGKKLLKHRGTKQHRMTGPVLVDRPNDRRSARSESGDQRGHRPRLDHGMVDRQHEHRLR